jgi:peptidoglycan/xylan/chitin deacetylase (PgdA/CDA1 family)
MVGRLKQSSLALLKRAGIAGRVARSAWRRNRLLILCYHGVSVTDEHEWDPGLYVSPAHLDQRLAIVRQSGCTVLPLGEAVERLYRGDLPDRAVAITFDDGYYDFMARALPILRAHRAPATVYLTTGRVDHNLPNVNLLISYALWCARDRWLDGRGLAGLAGRYELRTARDRSRVLATITRAMHMNCTPEHTRDQLAREIVERLDLEYSGFLKRRLLTLLRPDEVTRLAGEGVDFQMHTHLHRTPDDPQEFVRDVLRNRDRIQQLTDRRPEHFCYPSGNYRRSYVPLLREHGVVSATTCDPGIAAPGDDPLLLPRFIDTGLISPVVFESWVNGMAVFLPRRTRRGGHPLLPPPPAAAPAAGR